MAKNTINIVGNKGNNGTFNSTINNTEETANNSLDPFRMAFELGKLQAHMEQQHKETEIALINLVLENVRRQDRSAMISAVKSLPSSLVDAITQLSLGTLSGVLANKLF